jgi:uncharacterized protein (DUF2126 family)
VDHRLEKLKVTPDPGVIEVNIHPASTWDELVHNTIALYEEAHQVRLAAEKFMLDGSHTGTGGGNHLILGGPTPADSPLLRRPDLLRSLVTYWQHHPALSFQVKAQGLTHGRHLLACNGRRLPLHNTGTHGEYVTGVRYRAWHPPSALHPTIGVHAPLVFDLVDTWSGRSVGGCTYCVAHPGGRNYETFPVNANEAEARRATLFQDHGHTPGTIHLPPDLSARGTFSPQGHFPGPMEPPPEDFDEEYPYTLDLRH